MSALTILSAETSAPNPPVDWGLVPAEWGFKIEEFDLEIWAAAANALTVAELLGGTLEALTVADDDFTTTHATEIFTAASHGLYTGDGPIRLTNSGGALPAGVAIDTDYYVIRVDANTFKLAVSRDKAMRGENLSISGDGTGTHTLVDTADTKRVIWMSHGLLGNAGDGAVTLTATGGYRIRCGHSQQVYAYAITATFGGAVATSARLVPLPLR